jgi:hypothetical protein
MMFYFFYVYGGWKAMAMIRVKFSNDDSNQFSNRFN